MEPSWTNRVRIYVDELEIAASQVDRLLRQCRVDTEAVNPQEVELVMQKLTDLVASLEEFVARRESLLASTDAPKTGITLTAKLASLGTEYATIIERCNRVAELVADVNHRAVSLFVCQFHLAEFGNQLIRIVAGEEAKATYSVNGRQPDRGPGGGLLNDVA